jgi:hypothetical protein
MTHTPRSWQLLEGPSKTYQGGTEAPRITGVEWNSLQKGGVMKKKIILELDAEEVHVLTQVLQDAAVNILEGEFAYNSGTTWDNEGVSFFLDRIRCRVTGEPEGREYATESLGDFQEED